MEQKNSFDKNYLWGLLHLIFPTVVLIINIYYPGCFNPIYVGIPNYCHGFIKDILEYGHYPFRIISSMISGVISYFIFYLVISKKWDTLTTIFLSLIFSLLISGLIYSFVFFTPIHID